MMSEIVMAHEWHAAFEAIVLELEPVSDMGCKVVLPLNNYVLVHLMTVARILGPGLYRDHQGHLQSVGG